MLTTVELKQKLITQISKTENSELLDQISRLIDLELQAEDVYHLSKEEIEVVAMSLTQLDNGLFLSNEESNEQADKWLRK
jgi:hypothetical protein